MNSDMQFQELPYTLNEQPHLYGEGVHLLSDPFLLTGLSRLCHPECVQPEVNILIRQLYRAMGRILANTEVPRIQKETPTRMQAKHPEGVYRGQLLDPTTKVVFVGLARAGTLPAMELFEMYSQALSPETIRVDHFAMNRQTDENNQVKDAPIHSAKIGGSIGNAIVVFPDPMGATGTSLSNVVRYYKEHIKGTPKAWIALNLITTPECIKRLKKDHPDLLSYALRLDRGFSSKRALESIPGKYPDEEKGLNNEQYIVPGGGGLGKSRAIHGCEKNRFSGLSFPGENCPSRTRTGRSHH